MSHTASGCQENRWWTRFNRRRALQLGAIGGIGLSLSDLLRQESRAASSVNAKAKSVIFLWLQGGVSHHETFDMKPDAPADVRGEMRPISTNMPGVFVGEQLPRIATMMDKLAVIRSVTHTEAAHQRGCMYMVEGRQPPKATGVEASGHPHMGCMVSHQLGMRNGVPAYVTNPGNDFTSRFVGHGYLPQTCVGFKGMNARSLEVASAIAPERFSERVDLKASLEACQSDGPARFGPIWDRYSEQAIDIIHSGKAASAFDISEESEATQRSYGILNESGAKQGGQMGTLCLQARRLVEAGVRFVTVGRNSWDHHSNMFPQLRSRLPRVDAAMAGLIADLEARGLLDETLVVYASEFGRTPKINAQAGRDHWPRVFSVAFAGAGIAAGQVIGASDALGGEVADFPVSPEELVATILHLVGIHPQTEF
ncbi:MAG: DUF1501 domain-containing protein, partial [Planctomycetales bacterium]|nr:DUF1501 domain-containing protein [Planctomycetales bacterium]